MTDRVGVDKVAEVASPTGTKTTVEASPRGAILLWEPRQLLERHLYPEVAAADH